MEQRNIRELSDVDIKARIYDISVEMNLLESELRRRLAKPQVQNTPKVSETESK